MAHLFSHTRTFPSVICPLNNSHSFVSSPEDTIAFHHVFCALTTALRAGLINPEDGSSTLLRNSNLYFHYIFSLRCSYCSFWPTSCVWHYKHAYGLALRRSAICYGYCGPCLLLRTTHTHPHGPPTRGDASARQTGQRLQGDHIFATIFRFFSLRPLSFSLDYLRTKSLESAVVQQVSRRPDSHREDPVSISCQSMWYLWLIMWHCDRRSEYFGFPISLSLRQ